MRRRTTTGRVTPAGSSRGERLDPLARPLQREIFSRSGDEWTLRGEFNLARVAARHTARGITLPLSLPLAAYRGIAIRLEPYHPRPEGMAVEDFVIRAANTYVPVS